MKRLVGFSVLVFTTVFPTSLRATDEIRIIRGTLDVGLTQGFDLDGTQGLKMEGTTSYYAASLPWRFCDRLTCDPGEVLNLHSGFGAGPLTGLGDVTLLGDTHTLWVDRFGAFAVFQFDASLTLPEMTDSGLAIESVPFVFSGSLNVPSRSDPDAYDVYELSGSGVATVTLVLNQYQYSGWMVARISYEFQPRGDVIPH